MQSAYLVTNRSRIAIIAEFPYTPDGFNSAVLCAIVYAQMPDVYPSGVILEKRTSDGQITEVCSLGKYARMFG